LALALNSAIIGFALGAGLPTGGCGCRGKPFEIYRPATGDFLGWIVLGRRPDVDVPGQASNALFWGSGLFVFVPRTDAKPRCRCLPGQGGNKPGPVTVASAKRDASGGNISGKTKT